MSLLREDDSGAGVKRFWMIVRKTAKGQPLRQDGTPFSVRPRKRHFVLETAIAEMRRLAVSDPGVAFVLIQSVRGLSILDGVETELEIHDATPEEVAS